MAILLFESHQLFVTDDGGTVEIHMDLYKLANETAKPGAEFRFSWIAFETDELIEIRDDGGQE